MGISTDIERITDFIFISAEPKPADLAMIFGTSSYQEPLKTAKRLYDNRLTPKILISGGTNRHTGHIEAQEMAAHLAGMGVNPDDIIVEDKSANTLENVLFSKRVIEEEVGFENVRRMLVIIKNYHARRALMTLKRHFPGGIEFLPVPYSLMGFDRDNWHQSDIGQEKVMGEVERIRKYLAKGDIAEL